MVHCHVPKCTHVSRKTKGTSISYHRVPMDEASRKVWLTNMGIQDWHMNKPNVRVCSKHFKEECFENDTQEGTRRLKKNAVPTIVLVNKTKEFPETIWPVKLAMGKVQPNVLYQVPVSSIPSSLLSSMSDNETATKQHQYQATHTTSGPSDGKINVSHQLSNTTEQPSVLSEGSECGIEPTCQSNLPLNTTHLTDVGQISQHATTISTNQLPKQEDSKLQIQQSIGNAQSVSMGIGNVQSKVPFTSIQSPILGTSTSQTRPNQQPYKILLLRQPSNEVKSSQQSIGNAQPVSMGIGNVQSKVPVTSIQSPSLGSSTSQTSTNQQPYKILLLRQPSNKVKSSHQVKPTRMFTETGTQTNQCTCKCTCHRVMVERGIQHPINWHAHDHAYIISEAWHKKRTINPRYFTELPNLFVCPKEFKEGDVLVDTSIHEVPIIDSSVDQLEEAGDKNDDQNIASQPEETMKTELCEIGTSSDDLIDTGTVEMSADNAVGKTESSSKVSSGIPLEKSVHDFPTMNSSEDQLQESQERSEDQNINSQPRKKFKTRPSEVEASDSNLMTTPDMPVGLIDSRVASFQYDSYVQTNTSIHDTSTWNSSEDTFKEFGDKNEDHNKESQLKVKIKTEPCEFEQSDGEFMATFDNSASTHVDRNVSSFKFNNDAVIDSSVHGVSITGSEEDLFKESENTNKDLSKESEQVKIKIEPCEMETSDDNVMATLYSSVSPVGNRSESSFRSDSNIVIDRPSNYLPIMDSKEDLFKESGDRNIDLMKESQHIVKIKTEPCEMETIDNDVVTHETSSFKFNSDNAITTEDESTLLWYGHDI
ncbi:uncharacterized protein LOC144440631 [Glandiceps talaboti]